MGGADLVLDPLAERLRILPRVQIHGDLLEAELDHLRRKCEHY